MSDRKSSRSERTAAKREQILDIYRGYEDQMYAQLPKLFGRRGAPVVVAAALEVASRKIETERRSPLPMRLAVIAMGRLGGHEQGYGSDADVMFVHEPVDGATDAEVGAVALAEGVDQVARGDFSSKAVFKSRDELGGLTRSFARMTEQLSEARALVHRSVVQVEGARTKLKRLLGNPAYRAVWRFARGGIGDEYRSFLDGLAAESRHKTVPPNLPNTLRQYIAEEREALQRSQDVRP